MVKKPSYDELRQKVNELESKAAGHRRTDNALRESIERFDLAVRGAQDGLWDLDVVRQQSYVSPRYEELLGYEPGEIKQPFEDWKTRLHPEDQNRILALFQAHLEQKVPYSVEYRLRTRREGYRWFSARGQAIWKDGRAIRVAGSIRDITDTKQVEEALRQSEVKYKALVESSIDGIVVVHDKEICFANRTMMEMHGCTKSKEIVGHSFTEFVSPEDRQMVVERGLARERGEMVPDRYEFKALSKDGTTFDAEVSVKQILYEGKIARQAIIRNISAQKQAQEELKRKVVELDSFINNIPDMAWVKDADSRFVIANKAFGEAVGMASEALINQTCEVCFGKVEGQKFRKDDLEVMGGRKQTVIEENITDSKNNEIWLETIKSPILDVIGNPLGTVGIARDITKRKRAEEALKEAHDALDLRVRERTSELKEANERLEKVNTGLQVLIEHRQEEMRRLQKNIMDNVNKLITPYLEKMDKRRMGSKNRAYLDVITTGLKELVSPFASALSAKEVVLTPTEIQVADLIRQGKTSKEIAALMNVSANAITVHRYNMRKKLGLLDKKVNLRSYLQSLPAQ